MQVGGGSKIPDEIMNLVDREIMFKLQEKIGENGERGPFNVIAINMDEDNISKYRGANNDFDEVLMSYFAVKK